MKKSVLFVLFILSTMLVSFIPTVYAGSCPLSIADNDPHFCSSFKNAAACNCTSMHIPLMGCQDMHAIYARMIATFGTLDRACLYASAKEPGTTKQTCVDQWNCYINGNIDSTGKLCNSTGAACA